MKQKRILFVGAGTFQKKGIETAKKMGMYVIATDGDRQAAGLKVADRSYVMDVKDVKAHVKIARKEKIDGVVAIASEITIPTVAAVRDDLGLPGINKAVARRCHDKEFMRKAFVAHGVPSPKSRAAHSFRELLQISRTFSFPVVVKPSDNAGSRGVRKVDRREDLREAYEKAVVFSSQKKVIIEEFMEGVEVSVEAFVVRGKIHIITLSDKVRTDPPYLLDVQITFPSAHEEQLQRRIIEVAKKAIRAVGVTQGPVHMELLLTRDGPVPVELAARGPGFKLFTDIFPAITGIDLLKATVQLAIGGTPDLRRTRHGASAIRFLSAQAGVVRSIRGAREVRKMRGVHELELYVTAGDRTRALTSGSDRVGHIITMAPMIQEARAIIEKAAARLAIRIARSKHRRSFQT